MDEYLLYRHVKQIGYIHCKFKGWSASSVLDRADRLSGHAKLFYQIILPYLLFFSDLCEIVFHEAPLEHLCNFYMPIVPRICYVSRTLYVYYNIPHGNEKRSVA